MAIIGTNDTATVRVASLPSGAAFDAAANVTVASGWGGVATNAQAAFAELASFDDTLAAALTGSESVKTANYTVLAADAGSTIVGNSGSALTFSLPAASSLTLPFQIRVHNIGAGTLTIDPNASETINGAATLDLAQYRTAVIWTDGTTWRAQVSASSGAGGGGGSVASYVSAIEAAADTPATDPLSVYLHYKDSGTPVLFSGGWYVQTGSEPSHAAKFQNGNGQWYVLFAGQKIYAEQFGARGDGSTDCLAAHNDGVAFVMPTGDILNYGPGVFNFSATPNGITEKVRVQGAGYSATGLARNFASGGGNTVGLFDFDNPACELKDFYITTNFAHSGGACAISAVATTSVASASKIVLENIWITTQATDGWSYPIYIDGKARTTAAVGSAVGGRDIQFKNVHCFGSSVQSVTLYSIVGMDWQGGGLYTAAGTGTISLNVTGLSDPNSSYINIDISVINGTISLTFCQYVFIATTVVAGGVTNASSAVYCRVTAAQVVGTAQTNWTTSKYDLN